MEPNWLSVCDATALPAGQGFTRLACGASWPSPKSAVGWLVGHVACLRSFMECVYSGRKAEPGVEAAAQVQRVLEAAKLSEKEGRFVRVSSL